MKKLLKLLSFLVVLWGIMFGVDYYKVNSFEKPIFARWISKSEDDGGSGVYNGVGYSIELKGNFMPDDELPGVTHFKIEILGVQVGKGIRD